MQINLLKTSDEAIRLNKSFTAVKSVSGNLTDSCSLIEPEVNFSYDKVIFNANYAYIPDFGRYYFITDMNTDGKIVHVSMHSDVLMNGKADVLTAVGTIERCNIENDMVLDPMVKQISEHKVQFRALGQMPVASEGCYVINIGGRG